MRLLGLLGEAGRNLARSVTAWWFVVPLFVVLVGTPTLARVVAAKGVVDRVQRNSEAGVNGIRVTGFVDGPRCEAMAVGDRVVAAGAVRPAESIVLLVEPGSPVVRLQVTPGAAAYFGATEARRPGLHLSTTLDAELGHPSAVGLSTGPPAAVIGTFQPLDHLTEFDRLVLEVVPAIGTFEECLVDRRLVLPVDAEDTARVVDPQWQDGMRLSQVNAAFGLPIDGRMELLELGRGWLAWAPVLGGASTAGLAVRLRRREVALQRHLGASWCAVALSQGFEAMVWATAGAIVVAAGGIAVATRATSADEVDYLLKLAARDLGIGVLGALVGAAITAGMIRAQSVLRYLGDTG